jgi:8-oxo-dGTP diphosphatase
VVEWDTRAGSYCVVVQDGALLLTHWHEHGNDLWLLPGGGIEEREQPEQTAVREVFEESGLHVRLTGLIGVETGHVEPADRAVRTDRGLRAVRILYAAQVTGGELTAELDGSSDQAAWFPLDRLPVNRHDVVDRALAAAGIDATGSAPI